MNERAAWILVLLLTVTVGWYRLATLDAVRAAEKAAYERTVFNNHETIGALRTALRRTGETLYASEQMRHECHEGLGLARLRQHYIDDRLGLSERTDD